jgi:hypothetical protein
VGGQMFGRFAQDMGDRSAIVVSVVFIRLQLFVEDDG